MIKKSKTDIFFKKFEPLFPKNFKENKASYLLELLDDIESFGDKDSKLKNLGFKLIRIDQENGEYYESQHHYIILKDIKTKKIYKFEIYDHGFIGEDAIIFVENSFIEVKAKTKIIYE